MATHKCVATLDLRITDLERRFDCFFIEKMFALFLYVIPAFSNF
jgi:hypothetical protein